MARRLVLLAVLMLLAARAAAANIAVSGCPDRCGNVSIPYPFGLPGCSMSDTFDIVCDEASTPAKPYQGHGNLELLGISLASGQLRVLLHMGYDCGAMDNQSPQVTLARFTFSYTRNKFTALGCDTEAFIGGSKGVSYTGGCISYCSSSLGMVNGTCSGIGCCQTSIPKGLQRFATHIQSPFARADSWARSRCSYAFVVEEEQYEFQVPDLYDESFRTRRMPIVLDWSIGEQSCGQVEKSSPDYACRSDHTVCVDSPRGVGYLCNCSTGFQGNPYLKDGCQDINECDHPKMYPCNGRCKNTVGGYKCKEMKLQLGLGVGFGLLFLLLGSFLALWWLHRRKLKQMKRELFERNGGELLKQHMLAYEGSTFQTYTEEELKKATDKFNDNCIIGEGGQARVYKGRVEGNRTVAIKRFKMFDDRRSKEFAKEMFTLSQINHRNVVKLLGCCLEVHFPMLVFEFIPGGNLFDFLHGREHRGSIPLDTRLSIAADVAEALTYLHAYASPPIFHGDIKSANILLEENHMAKVTDFTASRLAPMDRAQVATVVQGTCGYLDPEYLQTCQLTEKSDVYSFGVVLVELLTRKEPLHFEGPEEQRNLASHFVSSVRQNRLMLILDAEVMREGEMVRLRKVAELACQCLKLKGEERPTMKEVLVALNTDGKVSRAPVSSQ